MPYTNVGDHKLHLLEERTGEALFLLHGNAGSGRVWAKVISKLASGNRVIAHDRQGFGESDKSETGSFGPHDYADELADLMDALNIDKAHVCGLSLGGMVASPSSSRALRSRSLWMGGAGAWITSLSNGCGVRSNTRLSTCAN